MVNRPLIVSLGLLFVVLSCFNFYGVAGNKADCTSLGDGDYICSRTKEPANCCQVTRNKFYTVKCIPTNCTALGGTCDCREGSPNNDACSVSTCCGCTVNCETLSGGAPVSCACHFGSKTACPLNQGECIADCAKVGKVCQVKPGFEIFSKGDCACAVTQGGTCVYPGGVTGAPSVTGAVSTVTAAPPVKPATPSKPRTPYYYPPYYYPPYYYPYPPQPYGPYYPPKVPYGPQPYYPPSYGYPGYGYPGYGSSSYKPSYSGSSGSPSYYPPSQGYPGSSSYYPPPPPQGSSYYPSSKGSSGSSSYPSSSQGSSSYNPPYGPYAFASPFNMFQSFVQGGSGSSGFNMPGFGGYSG